MQKLLCLLPFPPRLDANHGGSRVMAQMLTRLAGRYRLALLYLQADEDPPIDENLSAQCEVVQAVHRPDQTATDWDLWRLRLRLIRSFVQGNPVMATVWAVPAYARHLRALLKRWQPDLIQVEFHMMAQYLAAVDGYPAPRILTEHEPGTQAMRDLAQSTTGFDRLVHALDSLSWERFERRVLREVDAVVVFTQRDLQALAPLAGSTRIECIPLQTIPPPDPLDPLGKVPLSLLFVGNFVHPPNADAALRLGTQIFPHVKARFPATELYLIGDQPPPALQTVASEQVHVTGYVPDLTPYLDQAAIVVVPLRLGGGMRVKVLEAIAAGKAVVASPLAVAGLDLVDREQVLLAETDEEFCAQICHLLSHPLERVRLAANARTWACSQLDWDRSIRLYETLYTDLLRVEPDRTTRFVRSAHP
jgi:polysaccharide biosynthesis protein PslH